MLEDEAIRKKCLEVVEEAKGRTVMDMEERRKSLKRQVSLFRGLGVFDYVQYGILWFLLPISPFWRSHCCIEYLLSLRVRATASRRMTRPSSTRPCALSPPSCLPTWDAIDRTCRQFILFLFGFLF